MVDQDKAKPPNSDAENYNSVFERLEAEFDIVRAVAYANYKSAKREWVTEYRGSRGVRPSPSDIENHASTQTDAVLRAYRASAEAAIAAYGQKLIDNARPQIVEDALKGDFWRSFWPSFCASVAFAILLLLIVLVAAFFGFGLPIQFSFPSK